MNSKQQLGSVIEKLMRDLEKYAQRDDANDIYISIQNQLISALVDIYNNLNCLEYQEIWEKADKILHQMQGKDPFLGGFLLEVRLREVGHLGTLQINASGDGV